MSSTGEQTEVVYRTTDVGRRFGGVVALDGVDFVLRKGEVHGLLGANGAGKSTLVKILAGADRPTVGEVMLKGGAVSFSSTNDSSSAGIAFVSQELNLFPDLSALENLFLAREPRRFGVAVSKREMRKRARRVVREVGITFSLDRKVSSLDLGDRQLLEIARALLEEPSILILDEPTSALQAAETERLLTVLESLRDSGVSIIFVSHFLEDTFRIADRVTILRGGRTVVNDRPAGELDVKGAIWEMLGEEAWQRSQSLMQEDRSTVPAPEGGSKPGLKLEEVSVRGRLEDVSFTAERGKVTGLAGLEGSGAETVLKVVFGADRVTRGSVTLPSGKRGPKSITKAVQSGVAFVPADRKLTGLMLRKSIAENIAIVSGGPLKRLGIVIGRRKLKSKAEFWRRRLEIKMGSYSDPVDSLSGGNQQRVVFAKWLETAPDVILFDDPTRGVDIGAKVAMQKLIRESANDRVALYTSTDFEEMAEICDRILIFFEGRLVGEMGDAHTEHGILEAVNTGVAGQQSAALAGSKGGSEEVAP